MEDECECNFRQKTVPFTRYENDEWSSHYAAHDSRKFIIFGIPILALILIGMNYAIEYRVTMDADVDIIIDRGNCRELRELIAVKEYGYTDMEHAFKWLCVDQKVQEFGN